MFLSRVFALVLLLSSPWVWADSQRVLVLGDSLSAAYGIGLKEGWVNMLRERLQAENPEVQVINASVSGETTSGGLNRLPALLEQHQPHWVLIELGANDGLRGMAPKQIEARLSQLVTKAKRSGAKVLLIGVRLPPNYGRRYGQAFEAVFTSLSQTHQLPLVPRLLEQVASDPSLMQADGLHPTAKAQPQLLDNVWRVFAPLWKTSR